MRPVALRVALIVVATFLLTATLSSALTADRVKEGTGARVLAETKPVAAQPEARTIRASFPAERPVRARVGDVVEVRATSTEPDVVRVLDLGLDAPVGPDLPAELQFVADAPGRYAVRLDVSGRRLGVLEVLPSRE